MTGQSEHLQTETHTTTLRQPVLSDIPEAFIFFELLLIKVAKLILHERETILIF